MGNLGVSCENVLEQISRTISAGLEDVVLLEQIDLSNFHTSLTGRAKALDSKIADFLIAIDSDMDKNEKVFEQLCSQMDGAAQSMRDWIAKATTCQVEKEALIKSLEA